MKKQKWWRALETLADGATLAEWALELGEEFERVRPFVVETKNEARTYPCPKPSRCECRQHRIEQFEKGRRIAVCECGECPPIKLKAADVLIYDLNKAQFADAVARACGWTVATDGWELPVWRLGRWDDLRGNLFWCASNGQERTRKITESLLASEPSPFILLLPTAMNLSSRLDGSLKREGCLALPLDEYLTIENDGKFRLVKPLETARHEFVARSAKRDTVKLLRGLEEKIDGAGQWKPDTVAAVPPPPTFLLRQEGTRQRAGKHDRTTVSTWRIWYQGKDYLLPPLVGSELVVFLIANQGRNFNASKLTETVRKSIGSGDGIAANAVLFGDDRGEAESGDAKGRVGELHERVVIWNETEIQKVMATITNLQREIKQYEDAGDFSSTHYLETKNELEGWQQALRQNTKRVGKILVPKEIQKGTFTLKANLIQKNIRKLLDKHLRNNCRPLYDHLNDKNILKFGVQNCYQPKPRINWVIEMKKGT